MNDALAYDQNNWTQASGYNDRPEELRVVLNGEFAAPSTKNSGMPRSQEVTEHPVWVLNVDGSLYSLSKPVVLRVQRKGDHFFAENEYLDLCGFGDTASVALDEAIADIVYYYKHYTSLGDDEVVGFGMTLKERYLNLITG